MNSRVVAQKQTRRRLKQVARELMLANGYSATTIAAIAAKSGYTTGAVYSNFTGKAELGLEILHDLQDEATADLRQIVADSSSQTARIEGLESWIQNALNSGWPRMELEFALAARGDDDAVADEGVRNRDAVAEIADGLHQVIPVGLLDEHTIDLLAELVLDLAFGLAVRKLVAPQVHPGYLFELLARVGATRG